MAKFLKFIVNTIMIVAIVVAASLLIPPFAGVTTLIVDDIEMETNLEAGSVTYAWGVDAGELVAGDKVLLQDEESNVYYISSVNSTEFTLEDTLSTDGETVIKELQGEIDKVILTVPFLGYVSMALRTVEGLIIVGLSVIFVIILFILAEIWRKEEEDDWEEEEDEEEEQEKSGETEESAGEKNVSESVQANMEEVQANISNENGAETEDLKQQESAEEFSDEEKKLFEETSNFFAADIASMMGLETEPVPANENKKAEESEIEAEKPKVIPKWKNIEKEEEVDEQKEKVLAMPSYTKEELVERAKAAGDDPELIMDELSGVTFLDYSDIL